MNRKILAHAADVLNAHGLEVGIGSTVAVRVLDAAKKSELLVKVSLDGVEIAGFFERRLKESLPVESEAP